MVENQKKITYLFGAGASANVLPVVMDFPKSLQEFHDNIEKQPTLWPPQSESFNTHSLSGITKREHMQNMLKDIDWLAQETEGYASVDTFAKKLYLAGYDDYFHKLKVLLTVFFLWKQLPKFPDKRYDAFIASMCNLENASLIIPQGLRIISWNYDFQFEKAFSQYSSIRTLTSIMEQLNVIPRTGKIAKLKNGFCLIKLNGTDALSNSPETGAKPIFEEMHVNLEENLVERLTWIYSSTREYRNVHPLLNFAWENDDVQKKIVQQAQEATRDTEALVIIGYSFPFFNREIDRTLIRPMTGLRKVYFQAKGDDVYQNIERFMSIRADLGKDQLVPIKGTDQFFLPPEL